MHAVRNRSPLLLVLGLFTLTGSSAVAEEVGDGARDFAIGVKGAYLASFHHGVASHHGGGGAFVEWGAIHGWLELELCAKVFHDGESSTLMPIELLAKKPFHLTRTVHPYVGLGPALVLAFHGDTAAHGGLTGALGTYFWLTP
jgi:hypothetical protein